MTGAYLRCCFTVLLSALFCRESGNDGACRKDSDCNKGCIGSFGSTGLVCRAGVRAALCDLSVADTEVVNVKIAALGCRRVHVPENACNTVNVSCLRMSCKGSVERSSAVNRQNNSLCVKVNDSVEFMPFLVGNILGNYVGTSLDEQVLLSVYADIELESIVCSVDSECNIGELVLNFVEITTLPEVFISGRSK